MTDTPERIWAFYSDIFGAMWTPTEDAGAHEYTRADLTPTDAQVMAHPKVKALVEALREISDMRPHHAGQTRNECLMQQIAGDALRKVEWK